MTKVQTICGVDGGGTKTVAIVRSLQTDDERRETFGPLNSNGNAEARVAETLRDLVRWIASAEGGLDGCGALCVGTAGISNPRQSETIERLLRTNGYHGPLRVVGDHEAALQGALCDRPGMLLVSGTGSICYGKNADGDTARAGGWGHLIGDGGSGYAIGRDILAAVARAEDGCIPPTALTALVEQALGLQGRSELIAYVYDAAHGKKEIAALAMLLAPAVSSGDSAAERIAWDTAHAMLDIARAVAGRLSMTQGSLLFTGSVLENCLPVIERVCGLVSRELPGFAQMGAVDDAAHGALRLAAKMLEV